MIEEIIQISTVCFGMVILGLSLGFLLIRVQGE
jgi:hypothetical protein|uniref:Cytochrome b6/f complex petM subunit n=1 Tax=Vaucheria litorea TaxID=109269 RepID=B7T229_VAULI|nr:cytochrome b6/f complex petM subunit [Vaucheria litorea]ACF70995.1 cytochrome b6/f complex petM subunit [Vaucheria litorea]